MKTKKKTSDKEWELILHEMLMHDLLDDLGAPRHPANDKSRPPFGTYGRLKAYAESIGIEASMWSENRSRLERDQPTSQGDGD